MSQGNQPFWFQDFGVPVAERLPPILVRFASPIFKMKQDGRDRLIFSYSVELKAVRGFTG
jgi:hypothetical protein